MVSHTFLLDVMKLHLSLHCKEVLYFESKERRVVYYVTGYGICNLFFNIQTQIVPDAHLTSLPTRPTSWIYRVRYCL